MRIYFTSSRQNFYTARYQQRLDEALRLWPRAVLLPTDNLYTGLEDWKNNFRGYIDNADMLVFFTDSEHFIGLGVYTEIQYALLQHKKVRLLQDGTAHRFRDLSFSWCGEARMTRVAKVSLRHAGRPIEPTPLAPPMPERTLPISPDVQWRTKDGRLLDPRDMSESHLQNIVRLFERSGFRRCVEIWEAARRGNVDLQVHEVPIGALVRGLARVPSYKAVKAEIERRNIKLPKIAVFPASPRPSWDDMSRFENSDGYFDLFGDE